MDEILDKLSEISDYLGDTDYSVQINRMKESLAFSEYMISVMGQFSAGKSRLINNILERDILPVHTTETTAVITVIKYSDEEFAELTFSDGRTSTISVAEVKMLWQGEQQKLYGIESITVYLDSPVLRAGLVIADTPGINTVIEKHIQLAEYILRRSDRILYVLGKPMTSYDEIYVNKIKNSGLSIMFVRTHMDVLANCEETYEDAVSKELEILEQYTDDELFFLSNKPESIHFSGVSELRYFLSDILGKNIKTLIEENCRKIEAYIAGQFIIKIDERAASLNSIVSGNSCEYEQKKAELTAELKRLNETLERNKKRMNQNYAITSEQARKDLLEFKESSKKRLRASIRRLSYDVLDSENGPSQIEELVRKETDRLSEMYFSQFESMLKDNSCNLRAECMSETMNDFCIMELIPDSFSQVDDIAEEIGAKLCVLEQAQKDAEEEIEKIKSAALQDNSDKAVFDEQLRQANEELRAAKEMLDAYPDYEPQYILTDPGSNTNERTFRMVGNIADWATILIPGSGWAKGIEKGSTSLAKVLNKFPKLEKMASAVQKAGKYAAKNKKMIQAVDLAGDVIRVGKKLNGQDVSQAEQLRKSGKVTAKDLIDFTAHEEEKNPHILDFLSLEYHFGNIGKFFDRPPTYEIDKDYERSCHEERKKLQNQLNRALENQIRLNNQQSSQSGQRERQYEKLKLRQEYQKREQEQLIKLQADMQKERSRKIYDMMVTEYGNQAAAAIDDVCKHILNDVAEQLNQKVIGYIEVCDFGIKSEINSKIAEADALYAEYNGADQEKLDAEISRCVEYRAFLNIMEKQNK